MPKFLVETRDRDLKRTGVIERYTLLDVIPRWCDVGSWSITVPYGSSEADLLEPGRGVVIWVDGHDEPVLSGPVTRIKHEWSDTEPGGGVVTFSGSSDELALWKRVTYPQPALSIASQTIDTYRGSGLAGPAIASLVDLNAGPGARASRRIPGLEVVPSLLGTPIQFTSRFDVLGEKVRELATSQGLGFRVVQTSAATLAFEIYRPRDRAGSVVFSHVLGNLQDFSYVLQAPEANRFFLAAQGEGRLRYILPYIENSLEVPGVSADPYEIIDNPTPPATPWLRYWAERFVDRRDIPLAYNASRQVINAEAGTPATDDELKAMQTAADEESVDFAEAGSLSITPIHTPELLFGRDYFLGDRISIEINGQYLTDVLREVRLTDSHTGGPVIRPVVGSDGATETPLLYRQVRKLWASLRKLEARR
ncbi:siphovirus ReqiPepy6 Gp37-like family protein [Nonomuraea gerenzanensis]|uniref:siphovirus ReqiPepy6 Gp37-like family protein n=1 Tax=Nonomuraea gerenzanensis TaxID=93944 RepID=UPI001CDA294C|nr:siphovirus ReqiPepy6 Gp37-like family protein [Nonomuraea gerenzanensis]UBU12919.1 siphovirus ReqiPepy6 Gp37-like family protein [Nonomuraea gerenzanensis]